MSTAYDDSPETRKLLYEQTKSELLLKQIANSTSYDTAVLTLSSAFLGLSVTFVKDIVGPLNEANSLWVLFASWISFCLAIISTVLSFMVSQAGYRQLLRAAERYYLDKDLAAYDVSVTIASRIERLNVLNGIFFIVGTALLLGFTMSNFTRIAATPVAHQSPSGTEQKGQPTQPFQKLPNPAPASPAAIPAPAPTSAPAGTKTGA